MKSEITKDVKKIRKLFYDFSIAFASCLDQIYELREKLNDLQDAIERGELKDLYDEAESDEK